MKKLNMNLRLCKTVAKRTQRIKKRNNGMVEIWVWAFHFFPHYSNIPSFQHSNLFALRALRPQRSGREKKKFVSRRGAETTEGISINGNSLKEKEPMKLFPAHSVCPSGAGERKRNFSLTEAAGSQIRKKCKQIPDSLLLLNFDQSWLSLRALRARAKRARKKFVSRRARRDRREDPQMNNLLHSCLVFRQIFLFSLWPLAKPMNMVQGEAGERKVIKKLALSFGPTPARRNLFPVGLSLYMAFVTVSLSHRTESLLAIMTTAGAAKFTLFECGLGYRISTLFHLENFGMTIGALKLILSRMGIVAIGYRA